MVDYPLGLLLLQVLRDGGVLGGGDGMLAGSDQQLYLTFIRDAGTDVLISNEYRLGDSDGVFLHPMWLLSGGLYALGVDVRVALLLWKPVAAVALGAGVWLYAGRFVAGWGRVAATALGLFFFSPVAAVLLLADDLSGLDRLVLLFTSGESTAALQLWGYLHAALTIGLMALFLLGVERVLGGGDRRGSYLAWTSAAGAVVAWLHPWKGATLLAILGGLALWGRLRRATGSSRSRRWRSSCRWPTSPSSRGSTTTGRSTRRSTRPTTRRRGSSPSRSCRCSFPPWPACARSRATTRAACCCSGRRRASPSTC